jgi:hypothetical protein
MPSEFARPRRASLVAVNEGLERAVRALGERMCTKPTVDVDGTPIVCDGELLVGQ